MQKVITNIEVYNLENSIKRAKYPMSTDINKVTSELTEGIKALGKSPKGEGHDQWLTGILVSFDLTFTIKAWTEIERYHFIDFTSSQSTMHKITKFKLDTSYCEYTDKRIIDIMNEKISKYNELLSSSENVSNDIELEKRYLEILYSNPCGFKLTAGMTTNYRQLKTIYSQRKNHRLPEWRIFCEQLLDLPHFVELCIN